ncbi:two-component system nitrogen regulation sensor histidine kinase NtrY [Rhodoblastus acidophilus]|uniref:sensor histidine kinase NtrY-like n=1 Tax=Rhodoblastus acidophilus TaxID=1074 RepID=UPI0022252F73|nr:PAS domain-containing sensor histidine kinase [Rhodoblastus acidophilus]MCW2285522.1 two-component system nitrogen regulation sensor histidine kinase NtrY [Rhodoblastus acidophilus]MCW2334562.1 two-component system nitrogen regulation sensor histidine kinase NtrY [Rhodoblastus acidophilus]
MIGTGEREEMRKQRRSERRLLPRLGPFIVTFAIFCAVASFLIFAGLTPITPTDEKVTILFLVDFGVLLLLVLLVAFETAILVRAWRAKTAAAGLHIRIVALFAVIAAVPALSMAIVGSVTLDRTLNPAFMRDVRGFIGGATEAADLFKEDQCRSLLQEAQLTAGDLDRGKPMFDADRGLFKEFFSSRAKFLGFTAAALIKRDGTIVEQADVASGRPDQIVKPQPADFDDAAKNEPLCLIPNEGRNFVALRPLPAFSDVFLYASRPINPFTIEFPKQAKALVDLFGAFEAHRHNLQLTFAIMFGLLAAILLLSAVWLGLAFTNLLVAPIRRLIAATDQVTAGNFYVQVPVRAAEGDLAHLGETFNKMTTELRLQQNRLIAANHMLDERRLFTEAVLSGVPVAVLGVGARGDLTVANPSARDLIGDEEGVGKPVAEIMPELEPILDEARGGHARLTQKQMQMTRAGRERIYNVRIAPGPLNRGDRTFVATLDDMTDLVTAQRTSAWADVARRIAHEIKNPLTPIQLSAERLKRKYGRVIVNDKDIFDQCTDTIIRQVDDIKRMVDEFSSFSRMPKAQLQDDDLRACIEQVLFLMRVGHPDIEIVDHLPEGPQRMRFDRRLVSQALTNVVKNATEGIAATEMEDRLPRIVVSLRFEEGQAIIDVEDNGKGFPRENRARLLEPYMTTRKEGTGLGLPIVQKIFEDHGGGIELLDATSGQGALVRLHFPLNKPSQVDHGA